MPIVGGLILAGVLVGIVMVLTKRAEAGTATQALPGGGDDYNMPPLDVSTPESDYVTPESTSPLPPGEAEHPAQEYTPEPPKPPARAIPPEVQKAVVCIKESKEQGKPCPPEVIAEGVEAAKRAGMPETAQQLAAELDKTMTEKIPALIATPDVPGSSIPVDKVGKKLWFVDVRGGVKMVIPNFSSQLAAFKALQRAIGGKTKPDGRIGAKTLDAFVAKLDLLGFERYPRTVEDLAANAVKWTEVLKKHFQPGQVGRPFDVPSRQWREFVARVNMDWDKLAPAVKQKLGIHIGREVDGQVITLSGLCGVVNRAGMRGAEKWLASESDRKKYPATTRAFRSTNGIF
jgi:hypothetical protein